MLWKIVPAVVFPLVASVLFVTEPVGAHGFGPRYDLPVPLNLFLIGAAFTVAFSFLVIAFLLRQKPFTYGYPRYTLSRHLWLRKLILTPVIRCIFRCFGVASLILIIATGYLGNQDPNVNFAPTMVWIIWWVGTVFLVALVGNIWELVNPWTTIFDTMEKLYCRISKGESLALNYPYPERWSCLPAFCLFLAFIWIEHAFFNSHIPGHIASMAMFYTVITLAGMLIFGKYQWLNNGECFSLFFRFMSGFAPTEIRVVDPLTCDRCTSICQNRNADRLHPQTQTGSTQSQTLPSWSAMPNSRDSCVNCMECVSKTKEWEFNLRPIAVGLLQLEHRSKATTVFVVFMLASVTFDGFTATPAWDQLVNWAIPQLARLLVNDVYLLFSIISTLGLLFLPSLFLAAYLIVSILMKRLGQSQISVTAIAHYFVLTLIPIALAYHLSHYLSYLAVQGQLLIPLISDPFGYGWNLLGTASYQINIAIVNSKFVWYFSVGTIVIGHIIAVYLSHQVSLAIFSNRRNAMASQYPMVTLMIVYTIISLWIVAQPIIEIAPSG